MTQTCFRETGRFGAGSSRATVQRHGRANAEVVPRSGVCKARNRGVIMLAQVVSDLKHLLEKECKIRSPKRHAGQSGAVEGKS